MIYLDYAANVPVKEEVLQEFLRVERTFRGNTNSLHGEGRAAKAEFDRLNEKFLSLLKLDKEEYEIIYTSSATEANNLAVKGLAKAYSGYGNKILVSEFEHNSVNACLSFLKSEGVEVEFISSLPNGKIDLNDLKTKLSSSVLLVCVALVEGETGSVQDDRAIRDVLKNYPDCRFFTDATQAVGKIDIDFSVPDLISFAPHKFGGLAGTGVLIKKKSVVLTPLIHGGNSVSVYRSGSAPLGLIASTVKAAELSFASLKENYAYVKELSDRLKEEAGRMKNVTVNSFDNPYIVNFSVSGKRAAETVKYFDANGFCVSQKSACSLANTPSKTIMSIYRDKARALSSFRVSLCERTTKEEISRFLRKLKEYVDD